MIPIIDLTEPKAAIAGQIADACSRWGFFQIVNHGIADTLIDRVWQQSHRFFALSQSQKRAVYRDKTNPRGYYDRELTKNKRDLKEVFDFGVVANPQLPDDHPDNGDAVNGYNRWPMELPAFRATLWEYFGNCERLAFGLLHYYCLGLDLPANELDCHFKANHTSFIRVNHYPLDDPLGEPELASVAALGDMALHHHSDSGAFTILLQDDVGGLQVYANGKWWDVTPLEKAIVINTADMMQVWSNDRFRAPLHRVSPITNRPRYSLPFFFNPSYASNCAPLSPLTVGDKPHYKAINWGIFRQRRTDGDYADYGRETQIDDYRIR